MNDLLLKNKSAHLCSLQGSQSSQEEHPSPVQKAPQISIALLARPTLRKHHLGRRHSFGHKQLEQGPRVIA